eukprot:CAMPEP_0194393992 /NCGR_PEP_ID=MMETSP0174-20130528/123606_1 /TAXON_ID=216777 /ORGANISM="Proboscia alata, Strain PI-D3" /LENGTH=592 /DNA_ID=CAMNT_0039189739 /DNA_START=107 /DNA_END=1885 /DNA_ORIENTATION=-
MIHSLDVTQVATDVSKQSCLFMNSYACIGRCLEDDKNGCTVEMAWCDTPTNLESFWPHECRSLSKERKQIIFWQFHRSMACHIYTAILAKVLKGLCDDGVPMSYEGRPVVDILVLDMAEFDVSDILATKGPDSCLRVRDPVSGRIFPILATHEVMEQQIELGELGCSRLGMKIPEMTPDICSSIKQIKQHRPLSFKGSVPHWWVAVVVEGVNRIGKKEWIMVHLDICGSAYDSAALVPSKETNKDSLVPLKVFCTPEYVMIPNSDPKLKHKLELKPLISERNQGTETLSIALQPKSNRYFRCYHKDDTSFIGVTPIATYVEHQVTESKIDDAVNYIISYIKNDTLPSIATIGSQVTVCNIQSKPELNGRKGRIHSALDGTKNSTGRIPVLIQGLKKPVQLKPTCLRFGSTPSQYQSKYELQRKHKELLEDDTLINHISQKQKNLANAALNKYDPAVMKVLSSITSGQMAFSKLADPEFKRGYERLLKPPLSTLLPAELIPRFQDALELSNHRKAGDAIKLINIMKSAKQRFLEHDPSLVHGDGSVAIGADSDMMHLTTSVVSKINVDLELRYVFERLDDLGLYVNPCKRFAV